MFDFRKTLRVSMALPQLKLPQREVTLQHSRVVTKANEEGTREKRGQEEADQPKSITNSGNLI